MAPKTPVIARSSCISRFAPSPTGLLHLGHAYSALCAYRAARAHPGGRFLLRIEDIDPVRCQPRFVDAIIEDLAWLGFDWEQPPRRQSEHLDAYGAVLDRLRDAGLLYPCFCSRKDVMQALRHLGDAAPVGPDGPVYPGLCRGMDPVEQAERRASGEAHSWRLDMNTALARLSGATLHWDEHGRGLIPADPAAFGDVVLGRKDVDASYHIAVVWDDHMQGVTHVVRGQDLFAQTALHRLLQALLGLEPPLYHHHSLIMDESGQAMAKRRNSDSLADIRKKGFKPIDIWCALGEREDPFAKEK